MAREGAAMQALSTLAWRTLVLVEVESDYADAAAAARDWLPYTGEESALPGLGGAFRQAIATVRAAHEAALHHCLGLDVDVRMLAVVSAVSSAACDPECHALVHKLRQELAWVAGGVDCPFLLLLDQGKPSASDLRFHVPRTAQVASRERLMDGFRTAIENRLPVYALPEVASSSLVEVRRHCDGDGDDVRLELDFETTERAVRFAKVQWRLQGGHFEEEETHYCPVERVGRGGKKKDAASGRRPWLWRAVLGVGGSHGRRHHHHHGGGGGTPPADARVKVRLAVMSSTGCGAPSSSHEQSGYLLTPLGRPLHVRQLSFDCHGGLLEWQEPATGHRSSGGVCGAYRLVQPDGVVRTTVERSLHVGGMAPGDEKHVTLCALGREDPGDEASFRVRSRPGRPVITAFTLVSRWALDPANDHLQQSAATGGTMLMHLDWMPGECVLDPAGYTVTVCVASTGRQVWSSGGLHEKGPLNVPLDAADVPEDALELAARVVQVQGGEPGLESEPSTPATAVVRPQTPAAPLVEGVMQDPAHVPEVSNGVVQVEKPSRQALGYGIKVIGPAGGVFSTQYLPADRVPFRLAGMAMDTVYTTSMRAVARDGLDSPHGPDAQFRTPLVAPAPCSFEPTEAASGSGTGNPVVRFSTANYSPAMEGEDRFAFQVRDARSGELLLTVAEPYSTSALEGGRDYLVTATRLAPPPVSSVPSTATRLRTPPSAVVAATAVCIQDAMARSCRGVVSWDLDPPNVTSVAVTPRLIDGQTMPKGFVLGKTVTVPFGKQRTAVFPGLPFLTEFGFVVEAQTSFDGGKQVQKSTPCVPEPRLRTPPGPPPVPEISETGVTDDDDECAARFPSTDAEVDAFGDAVVYRYEVTEAAKGAGDESTDPASSDPVWDALNGVVTGLRHGVAYVVTRTVVNGTFADLTSTSTPFRTPPAPPAPPFVDGRPPGTGVHVTFGPPDSPSIYTVYDEDGLFVQKVVAGPDGAKYLTTSLEPGRTYTFTVATKEHPDLPSAVTPFRTPPGRLTNAKAIARAVPGGDSCASNVTWTVPQPKAVPRFVAGRGGEGLYRQAGAKAPPPLLAKAAAAAAADIQVVASLTADCLERNRVLEGTVVVTRPVPLSALASPELGSLPFLAALEWHVVASLDFAENERLKLPKETLYSEPVTPLPTARTPPSAPLPPDLTVEATRKTYTAKFATDPRLDAAGDTVDLFSYTLTPQKTADAAAAADSIVMGLSPMTKYRASRRVMSGPFTGMTSLQGEYFTTPPGASNPPEVDPSWTPDGDGSTTTVTFPGPPPDRGDVNLKYTITDTEPPSGGGAPIPTIVIGPGYETHALPGGHTFVFTVVSDGDPTLVSPITAFRTPPDPPADIAALFTAVAPDGASCSAKVTWDADLTPFPLEVTPTWKKGPNNVRGATLVTDSTDTSSLEVTGLPFLAVVLFEARTVAEFADLDDPTFLAAETLRSVELPNSRKPVVYTPPSAPEKPSTSSDTATFPAPPAKGWTDLMGNSLSYTYTVRPVDGDAVLTSSSANVVTGLQPGVTYTATRTVVGGGVFEGLESTASVRFRTAPGRVTATVINGPGNGQVTVSWPYDAPGAVGYKVVRTQPRPAEVVSPADGVGIMLGKFVVSDVGPNTEVRFEVIAFDEDGVEGPPASTGAIYTPPSVPTELEVDGEVTGNRDGRTATGRLTLPEVGSDLTYEFRLTDVSGAAPVVRVVTSLPGQAMPKVVTDLSLATTFQVDVRALTKSGVPSAFSSPTVRLVTPTAPPTQVEVGEVQGDGGGGSTMHVKLKLPTAWPPLSSTEVAKVVLVARAVPTAANLASFEGVRELDWSDATNGGDVEVPVGATRDDVPPGSLFGGTAMVVIYLADGKIISSWLGVSSESYETLPGAPILETPYTLSLVEATVRAMVPFTGGLGASSHRCALLLEDRTTDTDIVGTVAVVGPDTASFTSRLERASVYTPVLWAVASDGIRTVQGTPSPDVVEQFLTPPPPPVFAPQEGHTVTEATTDGLVNCQMSLTSTPINDTTEVYRLAYRLSATSEGDGAWTLVSGGSGLDRNELLLQDLQSRNKYDLWATAIAKKGGLTSIESEKGHITNFIAEASPLSAASNMKVEDVHYVSVQEAGNATFSCNYKNDAAYYEFQVRRSDDPAGTPTVVGRVSQLVQKPTTADARLSAIKLTPTAEEAILEPDVVYTATVQWYYLDVANGDHVPAIESTPSSEFVCFAPLSGDALPLPRTVIPLQAKIDVSDANALPRSAKSLKFTLTPEFRTGAAVVVSPTALSIVWAAGAKASVALPQTVANLPPATSYGLTCEASMGTFTTGPSAPAARLLTPTAPPSSLDLVVDASTGGMSVTFGLPAALPSATWIVPGRDVTALVLKVDVLDVLDGGRVITQLTRDVTVTSGSKLWPVGPLTVPVPASGLPPGKKVGMSATFGMRLLKEVFAQTPGDVTSNAFVTPPNDTWTTPASAAVLTLVDAVVLEAAVAGQIGKARATMHFTAPPDASDFTAAIFQVDRISAATAGESITWEKATLANNEWTMVLHGLSLGKVYTPSLLSYSGATPRDRGDVGTRSAPPLAIVPQLITPPPAPALATPTTDADWAVVVSLGASGQPAVGANIKRTHAVFWCLANETEGGASSGSDATSGLLPYDVAATATLKIPGLIRFATYKVWARARGTYQATLTSELGPPSSEVTVRVMAPGFLETKAVVTASDLAYVAAKEQGRATLTATAVTDATTYRFVLSAAGLPRREIPPSASVTTTVEGLVPWTWYTATVAWGVTDRGTGSIVWGATSDPSAQFVVMGVPKGDGPNGAVVLFTDSMTVKNDYQDDPIGYASAKLRATLVAAQRPFLGTWIFSFVDRLVRGTPYEIRVIDTPNSFPMTIEKIGTMSLPLGRCYDVTAVVETPNGAFRSQASALAMLATPPGPPTDLYISRVEPWGIGFKFPGESTFPSLTASELTGTVVKGFFVFGADKTALETRSNNSVSRTNSRPEGNSVIAIDYMKSANYVYAGEHAWLEVTMSDGTTLVGWHGVAMTVPALASRIVSSISVMDQGTSALSTAQTRATADVRFTLGSGATSIDLYLHAADRGVQQLVSVAPASFVTVPGSTTDRIIKVAGLVLSTIYHPRLLSKVGPGIKDTPGLPALADVPSFVTPPPKPNVEMALGEGATSGSVDVILSLATTPATPPPGWTLVYTVAHKLSGDTAWTSIRVETLPQTLPNLVDQTKYDFRVSATNVVNPNIVTTVLPKDVPLESAPSFAYAVDGMRLKLKKLVASGVVPSGSILLAAASLAPVTTSTTVTCGNVPGAIAYWFHVKNQSGDSVATLGPTTVAAGNTIRSTFSDVAIVPGIVYVCTMTYSIDAPGSSDDSEESAASEPFAVLSAPEPPYLTDNDGSIAFESPLLGLNKVGGATHHTVKLYTFGNTSTPAYTITEVLTTNNKSVVKYPTDSMTKGVFYVATLTASLTRGGTLLATSSESRASLDRMVVLRPPKLEDMLHTSKAPTVTDPAAIVQDQTLSLNLNNVYTSPGATDYQFYGQQFVSLASANAAKNDFTSGVAGVLPTLQLPAVRTRPTSAATVIDQLSKFYAWGVNAVFYNASSTTLLFKSPPTVKVIDDVAQPIVPKFAVRPYDMHYYRQTYHAFDLRFSGDEGATYRVVVSPVVLPRDDGSTFSVGPPANQLGRGRNADWYNPATGFGAARTKTVENVTNGGGDVYVVPVSGLFPGTEYEWTATKTATSNHINVYMNALGGIATNESMAETMSVDMSPAPVAPTSEATLEAAINFGVLTSPIAGKMPVNDEVFSVERVMNGYDVGRWQFNYAKEKRFQYYPGRDVTDMVHTNVSNRASREAWNDYQAIMRGETPVTHTNAAGTEYTWTYDSIYFTQMYEAGRVILRIPQTKRNRRFRITFHHMDEWDGDHYRWFNLYRWDYPTTLPQLTATNAAALSSNANTVGLPLEQWLLNVSVDFLGGNQLGPYNRFTFPTFKDPVDPSIGGFPAGATPQTLSQVHPSIRQDRTSFRLPCMHTHEFDAPASGMVIFYLLNDNKGLYESLGKPNVGDLPTNHPVMVNAMELWSFVPPPVGTTQEEVGTDFLAATCEYRRVDDPSVDLHWKVTEYEYTDEYLAFVPTASDRFVLPRVPVDCLCRDDLTVAVAGTPIMWWDKLETNANLLNYVYPRYGNHGRPPYGSLGSGKVGWLARFTYSTSFNVTDLAVAVVAGVVTGDLMEPAKLYLNEVEILKEVTDATDVEDVLRVPTGRLYPGLYMGCTFRLKNNLKIGVNTLSIRNTVLPVSVQFSTDSKLG
jgi:hypothetical protein